MQLNKFEEKLIRISSALGTNFSSSLNRSSKLDEFLFSNKLVIATKDASDTHSSLCKLVMERPITNPYRSNNHETFMI